jgi:hypothetical protein
MKKIFSIKGLEDWIKENKDHKKYEEVTHQYYLIAALRNSLHKHDDDEYLSNFFDSSSREIKELLLTRMEEDKGSTYVYKFNSEKEAWIEFAKPTFKEYRMIDEYGHIMCHHDFRIWSEIKRELLLINKIINEWDWL